MLRRGKSPHTHGPSEIWRRRAAKRAIKKEQQSVGERLRALREERGLSQEEAAEQIGIHAKHLQRLEAGTGNATVATLVAVTVAYKITPGTLFEAGTAAVRPRPVRLVGAVAPAAQPAEPFRRMAAAKLRPYRNAIPLYPLEVAAGAFGATSDNAPPEPEAWVAPRSRIRLRRGLFVARVAGASMSRRIPDGAWCVFRTPVTGSREGRVVLVQHRDVQDPDHGGRHTVKIWRSRKVAAGDSWRHVEVRLEPDSLDPRYRPIVIRDAQEGEIEVIAELVAVLSNG